MTGKMRWVFLPMLGLAFASAERALAQDPEEIVRRACGAMKETARECCENLKATSERAANAVNKLQDEGKDREARRVARRALRRLRGAAPECKKRIGGIAHRAIQALEDINADPEFIEAVKKCRKETTRGLHRCLVEGSRKVLKALRD